MMGQLKLIFLDRDGVINKDPGDSDYVKKWNEFYFLPRSIKALKKLTDEKYEIIVISNQAGVSKGLYSEGDLEEITRNMLKTIEESGAKIRRVYYCIHRDEDNCNCRKPKVGLFKKALSELRISNSEIQAPVYFIGDGLADVEAGENAGYKTILVLSGKSSPEDVKNSPFKPDYVARDLWEAVEFVVNKNLR